VRPIFNPKVVVCKVNANQADFLGAHVNGELHRHVGGVSVVRESVVNDIDGANAIIQFEFYDRDFARALFVRSVSKEIGRAALFNVFESIPFVLAFVVDVEKVRGLEESTNIIDPDGNTLPWIK
jgi:hypothetical protein